MQKDGKLDADTRFSMINLMEPDKQVVWGWSGGDDVPRSAFALVRQKERSRPNQAKREKTGVSDSGTKPTKN